MAPRRFIQASAFLAIAVALLYGCQARVHNPDVLWQIVSQSCVPSAEAGKGPGKCAKVSPDGYAILKDINGKGQHLLIPTTRVTGVEDPLLLRSGSPDYFRYAWEDRDFVSKALGARVPDELMSLALNSADGRTQNQFHIHVDCLSQDMRNALSAYDGATTGAWLNTTFNGHPYRLERVAAATAAGVDPFGLVLRQAAAAQQAMRGHTIFMASAPGGFFVVDGYYQPYGPDANPGSSEELQDHSCKDVRK
ncbi:MAG TPA: CDP-diacylglycerol diphosphatase [Bordetella sp.]